MSIAVASNVDESQLLIAVYTRLMMSWSDC